jgi:hypothetical protein
MGKIENRPFAAAYARSASARNATIQCINKLGNLKPTMLLVFCGGKHDGVEVLETFRERYGEEVPIVGGACAGAISTGSYGSSGLEISVLAFTNPELTPHLFAADGLDEGEYSAAYKLGLRVKPSFETGDYISLFYDSVATVDPTQLHHATAIVAGFMTACGSKRPNLVGGGMLTDLNFTGGWVYDGSSVRHHALIALVWPSCVSMETFVLHGCIPASAFLEITRIDGAVVYELDNEPAVTVLERHYGKLSSPGGDRSLTLVATLGAKQGDRFAPYDENAYVNRLILHSDDATGSVTVFEPDFELGATVQIMARDNTLMVDSVRRGVSAANDIIAEGETLFSLYIDCAGRASMRSGSPIEEAEVLVDGLDRRVPLVGFYSGVEIAPFAGSARALDWTGLLAVVRYRP